MICVRVDPSEPTNYDASIILNDIVRRNQIRHITINAVALEVGNPQTPITIGMKTIQLSDFGLCITEKTVVVLSDTEHEQVKDYQADPEIFIRSDQVMVKFED